ncbi:unnamed protein product, partial [Laminaria digitata]
TQLTAVPIIHSESYPIFVFFTRRTCSGRLSLRRCLCQMNSTGQALAFTSKRPGKTQQFNYFMMNNNTENAFYLVDMPGMGYAKARMP